MRRVWGMIEWPIWFVGGWIVLSVLDAFKNVVEAGSIAAQRYREIVK